MRLLIAISILSWGLAQAKTIYFLPGNWGLIFEINHPFYNGDNQREPTYNLKKRLEKDGYIVKEVYSLKNLTDVYCIITFDIPFDQLSDLEAYPLEKRVAILWEPPSVASLNYNKNYHRYFSQIYTWNDDLVNDKEYFKFYYPSLHQMTTDVILFSEKKLCALIACNKGSNHPDELYTQRLSTINYFENYHPDEFELYGRNWPGYLTCYRGPVETKLEVLKHFKFCICYENIKNIPGYITEKIFDAFRAGCVPVYWGASNIKDYIPENCFIDRRNFADEKELYEFMKAMDNDTYETYIKNIQEFLQSPAGHLFSADTFINIIYSLLTKIKEQ